MSWDAVRRWRDRLRATDPTPARGPLSPEGMRAAWTAALDALDDPALDAVASEGFPAHPTAAMACARTVRTAPIEWCAVLLGLGTRLVLKHPADDPGATGLLVDAARAGGLPLSATPDRAALADADLAIVMGDDATVAAVRGVARGAVLGFGHRLSVAWVTDRGSLRAVALDAALHDGRGCMSPVAVLTPLPVGPACDALADGMAEAERAFPRGAVTPGEAAAIRARRALARAAGQLREGPGWSVHAVPRVVDEALPRSLAVVSVPDREAAVRLLRRLPVSTVGTDDPGLSLDGARICAPGEMQRPPLQRLHDGVDWIRASRGPAAVRRQRPA